MSKLVIFDVDHTLFVPKNMKVRVVKRNGESFSFAKQEDFDKYKLKPGERYDWSDYRSGELFEKNAEPIPRVVNLLKQIIETNKKVLEGKLPEKDIWHVAILTARASLKGKKDFIKAFENQQIPISPNKSFQFDERYCHIYRAGDPPYRNVPSPIAKREIIENKIKRAPEFGKDYTSVRMYDDSRANLKEFLEIKIPGIRLEAMLVENGIPRPYK